LNVSEAVAARRSVRAFLPTPVARNIVEKILDQARFSPSGGNVQPWNAVVVAGEPLQQLLRKVADGIAAGRTDSEYASYPDTLPDPWMARRRQNAAELYGTLGIGRENREARHAQTARNWIGFDAPCIMFCHIPRFMGVAQWADLGIWLQTVMLLMEEAGLSTCAQGAWSHGGVTVREALGIADDHVLACGLAIGYADPDAVVNRLRTSRAPLEETVRFLGM